jgi:hypothetical protein
MLLQEEIALFRIGIEIEVNALRDLLKVRYISMSKDSFTLFSWALQLLISFIRHILTFLQI